MSEDVSVEIDPFTGQPRIVKVSKEIKIQSRGGSTVNAGGTVDEVVAGTNVTVDSSDPRKPVVSSTGGSALEEWAESDVSYFGGAVTGARFAPVGVTNPVNLEALDLSGLGQPNAIGLTVNGHDGSFYFIDTSTLTPHLALVFDYDTAANRSFTIGLNQGTSTSPELSITPAGVSGTIIKDEDDMSSNSDDHLATQQSIKAYADGKVSDTAYGSGWDGVTGIAPSKNAVYDKIESLAGTPPGGATTQVQYNDGGAFAGESTFTYDKTNNRLTVSSGYRMSSGSTNSIGDTDGNGAIYFDGNAAHIYGYSEVNFRDGTGQYLNMTRARFTHGSRSLNTTPLGGGNFDAGAQLNEDISAYLGKGFGAVFAPRVTATANNDLIAGTIFSPELKANAFTGLTKVAALIVPADSGNDAIGIRSYAASSQSVDMAQWVNSSGTVMSAIAKNGAIKIVSLADSAAENSTLYYSTTASKLVWKDSGGTVNNLY